MFDMRLRLPELMAARGIETAYRLHHASGGRISMTNAHHLVASEGRPTRIALTTLQVLADMFGVKDMNQLWDSEPAAPPKPDKRKR
jgi:hypothetical protein